MRGRFIVGATALLLLASCSKMPPVDVKGGGDHPFPAYLAKVDKDAIAGKKTDGIIENRFVHIIKSGEQLRSKNEQLVSLLELGVQSAQLDEDSSAIEDAKAKLSAAKAEQQALAEVTSQDQFIDCESGMILNIRRKGEVVERFAAMNDDPDLYRNGCASRGLSPGF